jgi:hypothetical protein
MKSGDWLVLSGHRLANVIAEYEPFLVGVRVTIKENGMDTEPFVVATMGPFVAGIPTKITVRPGPGSGRPKTA